MNPQAESWLKQARYDLETAEALYGLSRWSACALLAQQAAEKALKALIVDRTNALPPRLHDIRRLSEATGLLEKLPADALRLSDYYVSVRYPDASAELPYESINEASAARSIAAARAVFDLIDKETGDTS